MFCYGFLDWLHFIAMDQNCLQILRPDVDDFQNKQVINTPYSSLVSHAVCLINNGLNAFMQFAYISFI